MTYTRWSHTVFHYRYHIVWVPKYHYKILQGSIRERVRDAVGQVCAEMGVTIVNGLLSRDHIRMFVEIPPHIAVSHFVQRPKGRSSRKIRQEFPEIRRRYWGQHFWARDYFCTTSGNITDKANMHYVDNHTAPIKLALATPHEPAGTSR